MMATLSEVFKADYTPISANTTGVRSFCSVADAVVRYDTTALTSCAGTEIPLQQIRLMSEFTREEENNPLLLCG
jgi:hypothetical protein